MFSTGFLFLVVFPNITHNTMEGFIHIDSLLGRSLDELASKFPGKIPSLYVKQRKKKEYKRSTLVIPFPVFSLFTALP
jgi:hypothetical protein